MNGKRYHILIILGIEFATPCSVNIWELIPIMPQLYLQSAFIQRFPVTSSIQFFWKKKPTSSVSEFITSEEKILSRFWKEMLSNNISPDSRKNGYLSIIKITTMSKKYSQAHNETSHNQI